MASPAALASVLDEQTAPPPNLFGMGQRPSFASMYPTVGMNTPPLPSASTPWYGEEPGIAANLLFGLRDMALQANQAMPWGGNDPSAIGIDTQAGTIDPSVMVPFATNVAGMATTGSMAAPAVPGATGMGIRAYHGSPHDFPAERRIRYPDGREDYVVGSPDVLPDVPQGATVLKDYPLGRFREDKVGTGEGAQAYGHGAAYLAENEGIARSYRDALAPKNVNNFDWDKSATTNVSPDSKAGRLSAQFYDDGLNWRDKDGNSITDVAEEMGATRHRGHNAGDDTFIFDDGTALLVRGDAWTVQQPGRMYEVDIDASPDEFLDWDKPLSEQSPKVQEAVAGFFKDNDEIGSILPTATGEDITRQLLPMTGVGRGGYDTAHDMISEALRAAGIKGIRYKDAGSRAISPAAEQMVSEFGSVEEALKVAQQRLKNATSARERIKAEEMVSALSRTHNYVVFDESTINILKKYGLAGLTGGGAAAMALGGSDDASAVQPTYRTGGGF